MLSKEALEQFKAIWKEEYDEEISDELALEKATNFLTLFNAVYRPIKKEWVEDENKNKVYGNTKRRQSR